MTNKGVDQTLEIDQILEIETTPREGTDQKVEVHRGIDPTVETDILLKTLIIIIKINQVPRNRLIIIRSHLIVRDQGKIWLGQPVRPLYVQIACYK